MDKKRHGLQISGRMKLRYKHSKGDSKPCPKNCTAKRGSNQGLDQGISTWQRRGNAQRTVGGRGREADSGSPIRAQ